MIGEKNLRDYRLNKISENILLDKTKNVCEKTEAEFNIAYKYWLNEDNALATKHFNNVIDLKVYPFREYIAAKQILKLLDNTK